MDNKLREIEEALSKATPGPWTHSRLAYGYVVSDYEPHNVLASLVEYNEDGTVHSHFENWESNRTLIANTPEWLRYTLDTIKRLTEENERLGNIVHQSILQGFRNSSEEIKSDIKQINVERELIHLLSQKEEEVLQLKSRYLEEFEKKHD